MIQHRSLWYTSGTLQDGSVRWNGDGTLSTAGSVLLSNIAHTDPNLRFIVYRYSGRFIYGCLGFFSLSFFFFQISSFGIIQMKKKKIRFDLISFLFNYQYLILNHSSTKAINEFEKKIIKYISNKDIRSLLCKE